MLMKKFCWSFGLFAVVLSGVHAQDALQAFNYVKRNVTNGFCSS